MEEFYETKELSFQTALSVLKPGPYMLYVTVAKRNNESPM